MRKASTHHLRTLKRILDDAVIHKDLSRLEFADGYMAALINDGYYNNTKGFLYLMHSAALEGYIEGNANKSEDKTLELTEAFMEVLK